MSQLIIDPFRFGVVPFESLYEAFDPLTVLKKQQFLDWFSGKALDLIWNEHDVSGSDGAGAMVDAETNGGEGYEVRSGTSNNNYREVDFNNIRHYDEDGCRLTCVLRAVESTTRRTGVGLADNINATGSNQVSVENDIDFTNYQFFSNDASVGGQQGDTGVTRDEAFHTWSIELDGSTAKCFDGSTLVTTNSDQVPVAQLQPYLFAQTRTSAARNNHVRYLEVYNT